MFFLVGHKWTVTLMLILGMHIGFVTSGSYEGLVAILLHEGSGVVERSTVGISVQFLSTPAIFTSVWLKELAFQRK